MRFHWRALESIAGYQHQLADASGIDWLQRLLEAQADFTRDIGNLYASIQLQLRDLLRRLGMRSVRELRGRMDVLVYRGNRP